jgi:hypothetical protein
VARRVESKTRTLHQVTVNASAAERRKIVPPAVGSRSAKNGATRAWPASSRLTLRAVLALSASPKVMLPSELTKAFVWDRPKKRNANASGAGRLSSSPSVIGSPSVARKAPSIRVAS